MSTARINFLWLILFGLTLPLSVVVATNMARRSFERVKLGGQVVTVKGYAQRAITADRASWAASVTGRAGDLPGAYERLASGRNALLAYLAAGGFPAPGVTFSQVDITVINAKNKEGHDTNAIEGYVLRQTAYISSENVNNVAAVARDAAGLIQRGVELDSQPPAYVYTKLDDLKLDMLADAAKNAWQRAQRLTADGHARPGPLRLVNQGVFQVTPVYSTETSGEGVNDTSTIRKMVKAVITAEYALE